MKIGIIGAGNVGATLAMRAVEAGIGDVALIDAVEGIAEGKSIDISDASSIMGFENDIVGSADYDLLENSDIVVITAGSPRKPGASREELISKNKKIVEDIAVIINEKAPNAVVVVVTNPLDVMSYLVLKKGNFKKQRVIGMAGTLDTARFINLIAKRLNVPRRSIKTFVLGSHGDTMVPAVSKTRVNGKPLEEIIPPGEINEIIDRTKNRGAEVISFLKTSSAYYSPSAGCLEVLRALKNDTKQILCVSAYLDGEYGLKDVFIGVPAEIGKNGIEKIIELDLEKKELENLRLSARVVKEITGKL